MWILSKEFRFEAAHQLPRHDGKCARLHGHSWLLRVFVARDVLITTGPQTAMVQDYGDIKEIVNPLVETYLDHYFLNESTGLEHPTSEAIAEWVFRRLAPVLLGLIAVEIDETCTSRCRYEPKAAAFAGQGGQLWSSNIAV